MLVYPALPGTGAVLITTPGGHQLRTPAVKDSSGVADQEDHFQLHFGIREQRSQTTQANTDGFYQSYGVKFTGETEKLREETHRVERQDVLARIPQSKVVLFKQK